MRTPRPKHNLLLACVLLAVLSHSTHASSSYTSTSSSGNTTLVCPSNYNERIDCMAFAEANQTSCAARNCCWDVVEGPEGASTPWCFYASNGGYKVTNYVDTPNGFNATLKIGDVPGPFGGDVKTLTLIVQFETETRMHFKLIDASSPRWEVPGIVNAPAGNSIPTNPLYNVVLVNDPFALIISRNSTGEVILNTTLSGLVYEDMYISMASALPLGYHAYGVGEHVDPFLLNTSYDTYTEFARDRGTPEGGMNLYGVHPIYVRVEDDGSSHGVFFLNSNAMDIKLSPQSIEWRAVGGVLDFYVFMGPTAHNVVQQYTDIIGKPFMPPIWSLGFHLCRWGYTSANDTRDTWLNMTANNLPQDSQWNDIDYMDMYLDFTLDPVNYAPAVMESFVSEVHAAGQRYVMIFDAGIANTQPAGSYTPYSLGVEMDTFIKSNNKSAYAIGYVWPGETVFPDFFAPNATKYWTQLVAAFHEEVAFDAMWIDMNEVSSFGLPPWGCDNEPQPPYNPGGLGPLNTKTLCMSAQYYLTENYNIHSMYGYSETVASYSALKSTLGHRTMVISRSTFPGSGHHGGHWLGDNTATWEDLALNIPGALDFQLYGIPLVGADTCGFNGNTTAELCTRWMQLSSFMPFYRNHNAIGQIPQAPFNFPSPYVDYMRDAMFERYSIIPYFYTLMAAAHETGTPVINSLPLLFSTYAANGEPDLFAIDAQFMVGEALLISPVLQEGATTVNAYFPGNGSEVWYDFSTGVKVESSEWVTLDAPLSTINSHIRGGYIVPRQQPERTTTAQANNPYNLVVALDEDFSASGTLYLDDGISLDTHKHKNYSMIEMNATLESSGFQGELVVQPVFDGYANTPNLQINSVTVFGLPSCASVTVQGFPAVYYYNSTTEVLQVDAIFLGHLNSKLSIVWSG